MRVVGTPQGAVSEQTRSAATIDLEAWTMWAPDRQPSPHQLYSGDSILIPTHKLLKYGDYEPIRNCIRHANTTISHEIDPAVT